MNSKSKIKKKYKTILLAASCFLLLAFVNIAHSQDFATGINPPIIFMEAEAPANITAPITIKNQSDQTITYGIYLRPFKANSEGTGVPNYDLEPTEEYENFLENIQVQFEGDDITEITLDPNQSRELFLKINIEEDTSPTDKYFTVVFLSEQLEANNESSYVDIRGGIGTNVLLTIGPKSEPKGRIAKFTAPQFITKGPVPIELEIANHNDYYVIPKGNVLVENVFGHTVGNIDIGALSILGNSSRTISSQNEADGELYWNEKYPIGFYKIKANIALSEKGPLLTDEIMFFAFPIEAVVIVAAIIFIIIWIIKSARRKIYEDEIAS